MGEPLHIGELPPELMSADQPRHPQRKLSWDEFLEWTNEDARAEWVDGEVYMASPVHRRHDDGVGFLQSLVRAFVQVRQLGIVRGPEFLMRLEHRPSGRAPDLIFVKSEHDSLWLPTYLDGPADLVVEFVSPDSVGRDRGDKFVEYEDAGIPEYWLLDPIRQQPEFYQLDERGRYRLVQPDADGIYHSKVLPGFRLRISWLFPGPHPDIFEASRELGLI